MKPFQKGRTDTLSYTRASLSLSGKEREPCRKKECKLTCAFSCFTWFRHKLSNLRGGQLRSRKTQACNIATPTPQICYKNICKVPVLQSVSSSLDIWGGGGQGFNDFHIWAKKCVLSLGSCAQSKCGIVLSWNLSPTPFLFTFPFWRVLRTEPRVLQIWTVFLYGRG